MVRLVRMEECEQEEEERIENLPRTREDVLCGCGWGILGCPVERLPESCPLCGHCFVSFGEEE